MDTAAKDTKSYSHGGSNLIGEDSTQTNEHDDFRQ